MKDIIITSRVIKRELLILLSCFVFAFILNVVAIATFKTPWSELFSQIGYVVVITLVVYLVLALLRLAVRLMLLLFRKK